MTRLKLAPALLAAALIFPAAAAAKGPSDATITGPGLDKALKISGSGESSSTPLGQVTMLAGFFPAVFDQTPNPMLAKAPTRNLGPKYSIRYVVPGPDQGPDVIMQDLYPYAQGGALTYTRPGQKIFSMKTRGGWFLGGLPLKLELVKQGLPAKAPNAEGSNLALVAGIAVPGGIALLAVGAFMAARRRRPEAQG